MPDTVTDNDHTPGSIFGTTQVSAVLAAVATGQSTILESKDRVTTTSDCDEGKFAPVMVIVSSFTALACSNKCVAVRGGDGKQAQG
jgi:hypothetical protein